MPRQAPSSSAKPSASKNESPHRFRANDFDAPMARLLESAKRWAARHVIILTGQDGSGQVVKEVTTVVRPRAKAVIVVRRRGSTMAARGPAAGTSWATFDLARRKPCGALLFSSLGLDWFGTGTGQANHTKHPQQWTNTSSITHYLNVQFCEGKNTAVSRVRRLAANNLPAGRSV